MDSILPTKTTIGAFRNVSYITAYCCCNRYDVYVIVYLFNRKKLNYGTNISIKCIQHLHFENSVF